MQRLGRFKYQWVVLSHVSVFTSAGEEVSLFVFQEDHGKTTGLIFIKLGGSSGKLPKKYIKKNN